MIATSVCHTDVNQLLGKQPVEGKFPTIFGHEGTLLYLYMRMCLSTVM